MSTNIFLYQRATSRPSAPERTTTYSFESGKLSGISGNWTQTVPTGQDPLYCTMVPAEGFGLTKTIAPCEWTLPEIVVPE
jgi:hypothetical protein